METNNHNQNNNSYQTNTSIENKFLDDVLGSKVKSLQDTIKRIEDQISRRHEIRDYNIHRILLDSCYTGSELLNLPLLLFVPEINKKRQFCEQQLAKLEKEKRDEDTALWKDVQMLTKELSEAREQYQSLASKVNSLMPKKSYFTLGQDDKNKASEDRP